MRTVSEPGTVWSLQFHWYEHKARCYVKGVEAESKYSKGRYWEMVSCQSKTNTVLLMDKIILHSCSTGKKPPPTLQGVRKLERQFITYSQDIQGNKLKQSQQTIFLLKVLHWLPTVPFSKFPVHSSMQESSEPIPTPATSYYCDFHHLKLSTPLSTWTFGLFFFLHLLFQTEKGTNF